MKRFILLIVGFMVARAMASSVPDNLVVEGIPTISAGLSAEVGRYLEFRTASLADWHPVRRELLISTRFADTPQLHWVKMPGGARRQLTFLKEPIGGGQFHPRDGHCLIFSRDTGGSEFYQLYRYDWDTGRTTLLTDGKSRNLGPVWSKSGSWLAYTSTRRNGSDADIWIVDPSKPSSDRMLCQVDGGGWRVEDVSADDTRLLLMESISINESYLHLADATTGRMRQITPKSGVKVAYAHARFAPDGKSIYTTTDKDAEFLRLTRLEMDSGRHTLLTQSTLWDVTEFELSRDGKLIAFITNENGQGILRLLDVSSLQEREVSGLPSGVASNLRFHPAGREVAFDLTSANLPSDVFSLDVVTGRIDRWTESEAGGLDASRFVQPELIRIPSFDGLTISGFLYRCNPQRFPGKRPVLMLIHGGPEGQSRPNFQARNNYLLEELGVTLFMPNVRGSSGYGKTFLTRDNGFQREDSVKDIGEFLKWIERQPDLDADRIGLYGGSYGGYMVLASLVHYSDRLRCGIDVVGISNFLTFLKNTQDYRRDLRRAEYGDERDPAMRSFLEKIAPARRADQIRKPLLVVQGYNDPRVPASESEQMVKAIRAKGGTVSYLMAKDEGHGFRKKRNSDFMFEAMVLFLREHLIR